MIKVRWTWPQKKTFFAEVEDRTKETLLTCITEWIHPGTTIISDSSTIVPGTYGTQLMYRSIHSIEPFDL